MVVIVNSPHANKWLRCGDWDLRLGGMWRPIKEDIGKWLDVKDIKISIDHNHNFLINAEKWLQRYVFIDLHEIFFVDFLNILAKWI